MRHINYPDTYVGPIHWPTNNYGKLPGLTAIHRKTEDIYIYIYITNIVQTARKISKSVEIYYHAFPICYNQEPY